MTAKPFYVRKKVQLHGKIAKATACVTGLGQFIFYVNGIKAGNHELDPGWTDYRKEIQYVTFDITDLLAGTRQNQDEAVLAAEVGNGWFIMENEHYTFHFPAFMPPNPNPYRPFGRELVFAAEIILEYANGTRQLIHTDTTWKTARHPIIMTNVYGSETMDARLVQKGWEKPEFDDSSWPNAAILPSDGEDDFRKAVFTPQLQPPIRCIRDYEAKFLYSVNDRDIYDIGQNTAGILEFDAAAEPEDRIMFYPAEKLAADGDVDQMAKNWMKIDSCITYIAGGDSACGHYRMKFTYFAGRYIAVLKVKAKHEKGNDIKVSSIIVHAITSAWKTDGIFVCDDERFNKIYNMIEKTIESNMLSVHTDCPTIERFAWQEVNHLMAPSIMFMKDGKKLWQKFLRDIRNAQLTENDTFKNYDGKIFAPGAGLIPSQAPCYIPNVLPVPGMGSFFDIIPWGSTCIIGTYWHYRFYGDVSVIEENYETGEKYLEYIKTRVNADGFINYGLGDWGNPENIPAREHIETAFLYADAKILAKFAEILGKKESNEASSGKEMWIKNAEKWHAYAEEVKENYNKKLLKKHPQKEYFCYPAYDTSAEFRLTQACEALPLFWGLVPREHEADVIRALRDTLEKDGAFLCGEVSQPYVIGCACRYGMNELISRYVTKEEHPSYYAFILDGETTLGEYWEKNPRSHCHDMMGHIIEWYYSGIAGIHSKEPGFTTVEIRPFLPEGMHSFHAVYHSASGDIMVQADEDNESVRLQVTADAAIQCQIFPEQLEKIGKKVITKYIRS